MFIDLHSHTTASDGTDAPEALVRRAQEAGLVALAITDHDTFAGYEEAKPMAQAEGFDLVCAIELSTKHRAKTVHLLGYFLQGEPAGEFQEWLRQQQSMRKERNQRLVERLNLLNVRVTLDEVEAIGKTMTGRPHFARLLLQKGYVKTLQEAFDRYIGEYGLAYVERDEVPLAEAIGWVKRGGGISVLAHPSRLPVRRAEEEKQWVEEAVEAGLDGIEIIHSDHSAEQVVRYQEYARHFGLLRTGGSDHHGENKPDIRLGYGRDGNVRVSRALLDDLRGATIHA